MTLFIIAAVLLSLVAAAFVAAPLLRPRAGAARAPGVAALCALALAVLAALLYARLGDRSWNNGAIVAQSDASISVLARRLEANPQDLNGWLALGQAYSDIGRYAMAQASFERANRLAPEGSADALSGIAETMLLGGDAEQAAKAPEFLERALQLDPHNPKALFYSAVSAYQQGHLPLARERFATMLALGPPESVRVALQRQIDDIDQQLRNPQPPAAAPAAPGAPAAPAATVATAAAPSSAGSSAAGDAATAIHLHVTLAPALQDKVPAAASLFVFVRSPDGGAPLAVKRSALRLPQDVELSAADAMIAGHAVRPGQSVAVVARISASGNPLPQSGDLYGEISTVAGQSGSRALQIDRLSP